MKFFMHEHVKVAPSEETGVSIVTVRLPTYLLPDVMELADIIIHASRWLRTRSRAAEAIEAARKHYITT